MKSILALILVAVATVAHAAEVRTILTPAELSASGSTTVTNAVSVQSSEVNLGSHGLLRATYTVGGTGTRKFGASMILVK